MSKKMLFAPYYLFFKCANAYSDKDLLDKLGVPVIGFVKELESLEHKHTDAPDSKHWIFVTEDENWVHVVDNWYFDLHHHKHVWKNATKLAPHCDTYICWASDVDEASELIYFRDGKKVRHFEKYDYYQTNTAIKVDYGEKLECERTVVEKSKGWYGFNLMLTIAESIGIDLDHSIRKTRVYEIEQGWKGS